RDLRGLSRAHRRSAGSAPAAPARRGFLRGRGDGFLSRVARLLHDRPRPPHGARRFPCEKDLEERVDPGGGNAMTKSAPTRRHRLATPMLDLLEDAIALLRRAPVESFLVYLVGAVPFWLGLLYYLSDMSHDAYALRHAPEASLGLAVLYIWMK